MTSIVQQAAAHWRFVAPLLNAPESEDDYDALVSALDELLELIGDDEEPPWRASPRIWATSLKRTTTLIARCRRSGEPTCSAT